MAFVAAIVLLLGLAAGLAPPGPSGSAAGADRQFNLQGSLFGGWSPATITVVQGDAVTVTLTSDDGLEHGLFIDINDNEDLDSSDFVSGTTTTSISFSVPTIVGGRFTFYCPIHSNVPYDRLLSPMRGSWWTDHPPVGTILVPTASASWSGGSPHNITFSVEDEDNHPEPLTAALTYTYTGGSGTIQAASPAGPNPNRVAWTPPSFDATDVVIHLTVTDPIGAATSEDSAPFEVDSTKPTITSASPAPGATGVGVSAAVSIAWSERMNTAASGSAASFRVRVAEGPWLTGTVTWPDAQHMSFAPSNPLNTATSYEVFVNATAKDDSTPGNTFAGTPAWSFTTTSVADTTPPSITSVAATPSIQVTGGRVNLTASVQDDVGTWTVSAAVVGPSYDSNLTMALASGGLWFVNQSFANVGPYDVTIWAADASGNARSRGTSFEIRAGSPPPTSDLPAPAVVTATNREDGSVDIAWVPVTDPAVAGHKVYRGITSGGPYGPLTPAPLAPSVMSYNDRTALPSETYYYVVTTVDTSGAESVYSSQTVVTVPSFRDSPLLNPVPWAIAGATIGVMMGAMYGLVWRRRTA